MNITPERLRAAYRVLRAPPQGFEVKQLLLAADDIESLTAKNEDLKGHVEAMIEVLHENGIRVDLNLVQTERSQK